MLIRLRSHLFASVMTFVAGCAPFAYAGSVASIAPVATVQFFDQTHGTYRNQRVFDEARVFEHASVQKKITQLVSGVHTIHLDQRKDGAVTLRLVNASGEDRISPQHFAPDQIHKRSIEPRDPLIKFAAKLFGLKARTEADLRNPEVLTIKPAIRVGWFGGLKVTEPNPLQELRFERASRASQDQWILTYEGQAVSHLDVDFYADLVHFRQLSEIACSRAQTEGRRCR